MLCAYLVNSNPLFLFFLCIYFRHTAYRFSQVIRISTMLCAYLVNSNPLTQSICCAYLISTNPITNPICCVRITAV